MLKIVLLTTIVMLSFPVLAYEGMVAGSEATCGKSKEIHEALFKQGFVIHEFFATEQGFLIVLFLSGDGYVMTAEAEDAACILTSGAGIYRIDGKEI